MKRTGSVGAKRDVNRRDVLAGATAALCVAPRAQATAPLPTAGEVRVDRKARALAPAGRRIMPYRAACVQTAIVPSFGPGRGDPAGAVRANLATLSRMLERGRAETGARLYVFSEFSLQLALGPVSVADWLSVAFRVPGPETDHIAAAAQRANAYVVVNVVERIDRFPGRYFLSALIFAPSGDIVLNYRKLYDISNKTRPTDIYDQWIDAFGAESLFPVVDTAIGRLGCAIGRDVSWPEMVRSLALCGMEILANPTAEPAFTAQQPDIGAVLRRARAFENTAYLLMANLGPVAGTGASPFPRLPSEIIDHEGAPIASAPSGGEAFVVAEIDIDALRRSRTSLTGSTPLLGGAAFAQLQMAAHLPGFTRAHLSPVNQYAQAPIATAGEHDSGLLDVLARLAADGVLKPPGV